LAQVLQVQNNDRLTPSFYNSLLIVPNPISGAYTFSGKKMTNPQELRPDQLFLENQRPF
jgi:hypothetical protein